ncbi:MAG: DUF805 domain-containing protein [Pseudomonadota bacterium]
MNFGQAISTCLSKYANFSGRASRPEFWWFFLFQVIVMLVAGMVSDILYGVVALGLLLPSIAVGARRFHDIGKTGWLMLIGLIPVVNLLLIYWFVQPSDGPNAFGGAPAAPADAATGA